MRIELKKPVETLFGRLNPGVVLEMKDDDATGLWMLQHPQWAEAQGERAPEPAISVVELDGNSALVMAEIEDLLKGEEDEPGEGDANGGGAEGTEDQIPSTGGRKRR